MCQSMNEWKHGMLLKKITSILHDCYASFLKIFLGLEAKFFDMQWDELIRKKKWLFTQGLIEWNV